MHRRPVLDQGYIELEEWMGGDAAVIRAARICYQSTAKAPGADERLIRKLLASEPKHNTVFEHAVFRWHVKCPIFVARQWLRHRMGCLSGDALLYFDLPGAAKTGRRRRYTISVKDFCQRWHHGTSHPIGKKKPTFVDSIEPSHDYTVPELAALVQRREETLRNAIRLGYLRAARRETKSATEASIMVPGWAWHEFATHTHTAHVATQPRMAQMRLRMCAEDTGEIRHTTVSDIWESGVQPVFRVTLDNGSSLKMTRTHQCLTDRGWFTLEEATQLAVSPNGTVTWSANSPAFAINGVPAYQDREWLAARKDEGLGITEIAELAGCSYATIRNYMRSFGLGYSRHEIGRLISQRQKGRKRTPSKRRSFTDEQRCRLRETRAGQRSNFWKGGISSERALIGRWTTGHASQVHERCGYRCVVCGSKVGLVAHHIDPVWHSPEASRDLANLISLCTRCHSNIHRHNLEIDFLDAYRCHLPLARFASEGWRNLHEKPRPTAARLVRSFSKVARIEFAGYEMTYDLEVAGPYRNFVANGFIVHNSYNERSLRYCLADREYYVPQNAPEVDLYRRHMESTFDLYERLTHAGWRREQARGVLGTAVYTEFIWTVNAWSLMNWLTKRLDKAAQYEHRQYALAALEIWREVMPVTASAFEEGMLRPLGLKEQ